MTQNFCYDEIILERKKKLSATIKNLSHHEQKVIALTESVKDQENDLAYFLNKRDEK